MSYRLLIDGKLVDGDSTIDVINPATGRVLAAAPRASLTQAGEAIAAASRASLAWGQRSYADRSSFLLRIADALEARADEFARLLTCEQGKPIEHAKGEILGSVAAFRYYAAQDLPTRTLLQTANEHIIEQRYPLGVVAAIVPWNFPVLILTLKLAPALITGNVVIAKPAPTTPLTTLLLGELVADILPAGVVQTLSDQNDLGPALSSHPDIAHVSFTGATATGRKVFAQAAGTLKRLTLELGGNDAAIILDDADVAEIAPAIFQAGTLNSGQICLSAKRVYAPRAMVDDLCKALALLAETAVVGDGMEASTTIGPIQNRVQYEKLLAYIEDARAHGTIVAGGKPWPGEGYFITPTIVRDLPDNARLVREEQFGPVVPILAYDDLEEVIARVNDSEYGLGASVWTSDAARGVEVASRIQCGTVWVNRHLDLPFDIPFGGAKQSGVGRQQGIEGLMEFTQGRIINVLSANSRSAA